MLPIKLKIGTIIGVLLLCSSGYFVTATNVFQSEPLSCFTCDSVEDCALGKGVLRKCKNNEAPTCWTVFDETGAVEKRGCSDNLSSNFGTYCNGNPERCPTCSSIGCNDGTSLEKYQVATFPAVRHSCAHCNEQEDCGDADNRECTAIDDNDECFVRVDGENDIIEMGCRSDFNRQSEITALIKQKELWLCQGKNCNDFSHYANNFPFNNCVHCNSSTNEKCATEPDALSRSNCNLLPYTQCYERVVVGDGATVRGCLNDLTSEDFYDCLTGADPNCKACHGNRCNEEVIPPERIQCLRCDSTTDSSCHTKPSGLGVCPKYVENDKCVSQYDSGITKRGCHSEFSCDVNSKGCDICTDNGCNAVNVKKRTEEIYGIFVQLPLNCNTCAGEDCENGLLNTHKCEGSLYQDCLTIFDENGHVVRRGCESVIEANYLKHCEEHPELCFNCKSNGCNTVTNHNAYQECLYCDSAVDPNCLFNTSAVTTKRRCTQGCITSLYSRKGNENVKDLVRACLEDIDLDDRDSCATAECKKCDAAGCNTDVLPEGVQRLSCYHCAGSDCDEPVAKECAGYVAEDQCYIRFDNITYSAIGMGCKSDLTDAEVMLEAKQFFLCKNDICNDFRNLPLARVCKECDSATDVNCAVDAERVSKMSRCQINPYTDCYMRVREDGHTERGCLYNLPTDVFLNCRDSKDPKCKVCSESSCNQAIFPEDRPQCYHCNSSYSSDCEATPKQSQPCPIYKEEDTCTTKIINGVTHRACSSELSCEDAGRKTCRTCSDKNCNTINLIESYVGEPGIFQTLPLNCYHCDGSENCGQGVLRICEGLETQTCTTAFAANGSVISRGCSDSLDDICGVEGNNCYDCKSNGCNLATTQSDYVDCLFCDAQQGDKCVFDVANVKRSRKCHKNCMTALYPRTADKNAALELLRTCADDMELNDRESCAADKNANCKVCDSEKCNNIDLGERLSCYQCVGDDCQEPTAQMCRAVVEHEQCFVLYDETAQIVAKGCKSQYDPTDVDILLRSKRLWFCDGENCNTDENLPVAQSCTICNSRTDGRCAVEPMKVQQKTTCSHMPFTQCYMRVVGGVYTERGCLSSLQGDQFLNCLNNVNATECVSCAGDTCNGAIHPADRLSCNTCNSDSSPTCETNPASSQVCLKYDTNQKCISELTQDGATKRGCSLEVACDPSSEICEFCSGENCNRANLKRKIDGKPGQFQILPLTCQRCTSVQDCATSSEMQVCQGKEYCMTVFNDDGVVSRRGCSAEVESYDGEFCDLHLGKCHNCNSNKCNTASSLEEFVDCVYCDTKTNPDCVLNVDAVKNRRKCHNACMTTLYPRADNSTIWELKRSCLDDKDAPDQGSCQGEHCQSCTGDACNKEMLPSERRSCWQCIGSEDCEEPEQLACRSYKENDKCFILFDGKSDIARMGCESDLDEAEVEEKIHLLLFCEDGDNCNFFDKIPPPRSCAVCDSNDDPTCAALPDAIPTVALCSVMPHTECYMKVNGTDGSTSRGCVSSLPKTQMLACLGGNATDCTTCLGDRCNILIFPAERRQCHRCSSEDDPLCASSPMAQQACPYYSTSEFCAVQYVNGRTDRGCSHDFQCDDSDKRFCRQCIGGDNCNNADLASLDIGDPGKFQDALPLNCYTCVGEDCQGDALGQLRKCENNDLQTCGIAFANNGTVMQRGCSDKIFNGDFLQLCDNGNCKFCKSNGCNIAKDPADYRECLSCDSTEDPNCVLDIQSVKKTRSCNGRCMVGLYPRVNNDTNPIMDLSRGCIDDMDLDDRVACQSGNKDYCKSCEGNSCNTDPVPDRRMTCYVCNDEKTCNTQWIQYQECVGFREHEQCYSLFEGSKIQRMGCASDLETDFIQTNRRKLFLCDSERCNNNNNHPQPVACSYCNSTDDPSCAINPEGVGLGVFCEHLPYSQCFTRVDEMGVTIRGCLNDLPDQTFDNCLNGTSKFCKICQSHNCNKEIFPAGRRKCNRCNSRNDPNCSSNAQEFESICPLYDEDDTCLTAIDGNEYTLRGCASEHMCDANDRDKCRYCEADSCNTIDLLSTYIGDPGQFTDLPLNCYHCEGTECAAGLGQMKKCEGNNKQTCTVVFAADGSVSSRGCSDVVKSNHDEYCEEYRDKCIGCKSNGCNNATALSQYVDCYFCDSNDNTNCTSKLEASARTRKCLGGCMVALYPRSSSDDPSYEMVRTCLNDKDEVDQLTCQGGYCSACVGSRCNTGDPIEDRHECFTCTMGSNCEDAVSEKCSAYHPHDQCYTLFDQEGSIASMGCRSAFETDAAIALVKQKLIRLCEGKNCNKFSNLPTPKLCSSCNSDLDPRCATNPNLVANTTRCSAMPYTECYSHVNSDGYTMRGCLASLDADTFYNCLTNPNDKRCEICSDDNCNEIDVFPADRLRCHQCSSSSDPTCAESPKSNKVCPIYHEDDKCVTNLRRGITTRGCATSLRCDNADDKRSCRVCSDSGCNTIDLARLSEDGEPGKWTTGPLSCYTCKGEQDCQSVSVQETCEDPLDNCATVFNADGKVTQRGCNENVNAEQEQYCEDNPGKCPRCNSNSCNIAASSNDYVECLSCDTELDGNCVRNVTAITKTRRCYKQCMTALYKRDNEVNPSYGLSRTCFDDKNAEDRDTCKNGADEYCKVCVGAKCNDPQIPERRLSCNHCEGNEDNDCQAPLALSCANYRPDDECYIRFDEKSSIIAMGCRSEFPISESDYLFKEKRLFVCAEDNCNNYDALPAAQACALCNSRTDVNCSVDPLDPYLGYTNCAVLPFTQCYSRVLPGGFTERGCLSNLHDDEFLSCYNGTSSTCEMCDGVRCNRMIFPSNRASCHICDSSSSDGCESQPNSLSICPKYDADETCVTIYRNEITYRGCSSSLSCDTSNSKLCRKCTGDGCNVVDLARKQDDNHGKWQDLPLKCLNCTGTDCQTGVVTRVSTCANNNQQDCVVVFDENGKVIRRGCSDEVEATHEQYCEESDENCYYCKSNECNSANDRSEFVDCVYCDSYKDLSCFSNATSTKHRTRKCANGCMTALYASDASADPAYDIIRTCLSDKESQDQTTCSDGRDSHCRACTGDNCNTADLPDDRLSCYSCNGADCGEPESRPCPLYKKDDKCYLWVDEQNSVSEMGCVSSFRGQTLESILKTKRVLVCEGKDCNTFDLLPTSQKCAACNSNDNVACATDAFEIGTFHTCSELPYTNCYSKLAGDGSTVRGCLYDLPADEFVGCLLGTDGKCGACEGDGCNREIFPTDRLQCFTCTTEDDGSCESEPSRSKACPRVVDTESCVTSYASNITERGCSSLIHCESEDRRTCRPCNGTSCNTIDLRNKVYDDNNGIFVDLPLSCHTCEGEQCQSSIGPAISCHEDYEEDCMTVFNVDGTVRRRGCSDDVETYEDLYCRKNPTHCFHCKSRECNVAWSLDEYVTCAYCNSSSNPLCVTDPEYGEFPTRACYKECLVALKNGTLIRSCLDDKDYLDHHVCRADESGKDCAICVKDNCNKFNYPADRKKCHVCTDSSCNRSTAEYCQIYDEKDYCFAKYENGLVDLVGCASSQNATDIAEWIEQQKFYQCRGNECNDLAKLPRTGECLACDSSKSPECAQDPKKVITTEVCRAPRSECLTEIVDGTTLRMCANKQNETQETTCLGAGTCAVCSDSKCNNELFPRGRRMCFICNSVANSECKSGGQNPMICPIYTKDEKCVTSRESDGYVRRGCSSDIKCAENDKNCDVCSTDLCNSGVSALSASVALTLVLAFVANLVLKN